MLLEALSDAGTDGIIDDGVLSFITATAYLLSVGMEEKDILTLKEKLRR